MKVKIKIEDRTFDVEVGDLSSQPVVTMVDGERFEVRPESEEKVESASPRQTESREPVTAVTPLPDQETQTNSKSIIAPIPGVIESIQIQHGDQIKAGDAVCVIEAMKMKNTIRASRAGRVAAVSVSAGQHVKYGDVLVELE